MEKQIMNLYDEKRFGTARNYTCAKNSLVAFRKGRDFLFSDITEKMILDYESWLRNKDISRNTISFYMRTLRSVYNKAVEARLVSQYYPFEKVYTGVDRTSKRAVNDEIILLLREFDFSCRPAFSYTRDLFIFSFYTRGMAFIDIAYLKKNSIKQGHIQYTRHKTGQTMVVRLEPCMVEIINRYINVVSDSPYIFPIITNWENENKAYDQYKNALSYYNKQLKRMSSMLKLPRSLSSYVSRHTWATTAQNKQIPIAVISAGMGHSSEKTTRIYLASFDVSVVDDANHAIISGLGI